MKMERVQTDVSLARREPIGVTRFVFLLSSGFSTLELGAAIDSLSSANQAHKEKLYDWKIVSETGECVVSSAGLKVSVDGDLPEVNRGDFIFLLGRFKADELSKSSKTIAWLRRAARQSTKICGLGESVLFLARIGIINNGPISVHWKMKPVFEEDYPDLEPYSTIFDRRKNLISSGGRVASLDLFSELIRETAGPEISSEVASELLCGVLREGNCRQSVTHRTLLKNRSEKLSKAIFYMQQNLAEPVSPKLVAEEVGISTRQLERLFKRYFNITPHAYMMTLRLERARCLLQQTQMSVTSVAIACGFSGQSAFSKRYKRHFGIFPTAEMIALRH